MVWWCGGVCVCVWVVTDGLACSLLFVVCCLLRHFVKPPPPPPAGLAVLWSKATEKQKKKYEPIVTRLSNEYHAAMENYVVPLQYQYTNSKDSKKRKKDPTAPKKPATSYLLYSNAKRMELKKRFVELFF